MEGPNYTQFILFRTVKIGFYHSFISLLWQNHTFLVLDVGPVILKPFLFCKYLINSWNSEKRLLCFLCQKHEEKWLFTPTSQNIPGPTNDPKVMNMVLNVPYSDRIFLRIGIFQKRFLLKVIADQKKLGPLSPSLG